MPVSAPVIRVQHLTHRFGPNEVLHDIGFEVGRAEIFGFIGPNGAGKTTTIRAMATLIEPSSGRIEIDGIDVGLEPERVRSKIGYLADNAGIYAKLTVDEFLAFFAAAYRLEVARAVDRALELTDLECAIDGASLRGRSPRARGSDSNLRRRCYTTPTCSCSTSPRAASTLGRASRCAICACACGQRARQ